MLTSFPSQPDQKNAQDPCQQESFLHEEIGTARRGLSRQDNTFEQLLRLEEGASSALGLSRHGVKQGERFK